MARVNRQSVRERAQNRCEYCLLPQSATKLPHEVDHIRALKHRGGSNLDNTCFSCSYCNSAKGSNVAGYDPESGELERLFNPRTDIWQEHFFWQAAALVGRTPKGRATIDVLRINAPDRIKHRQLLIATGQFQAS